VFETKDVYKVCIRISELLGTKTD